MDDLRNALLGLQDLDIEIARAKAKLEEFDPQLKTLEIPITNLQNEIEATRTRLAEVRQDARRLERGAEQKRDRLRAYEERLVRVRNAREEAAARTEMDLVRRATEADETEALEKMEQATRTDLKLDDLERNLEKLKAEIAPKREQLLSTRREMENELQVLADRRQNQAVRLDPASLRLYERVRSGKSKRVLAPLTAEGACGNCFNILPIQEQAEVRRGTTLKRCEGCGVILFPQ
jgi:predicted  nucleic acid-binding Zn-ribbon protein